MKKIITAILLFASIATYGQTKNRIIITDTPMRYFFVYYVANYTEGNKEITGTGMTNFTVNGGHFLNRNECVKYLEQWNKQMHEVIIANVIEISKSDYEDWISETH